MKIYHQLNLASGSVKKESDEFFPLAVIVEIEGIKETLDSKISKFFNLYSSELDRYTICDKEIRDLFLSNLFRQNDIAHFMTDRVFPFYHLMADEVDVLKKIIQIRQNNVKGNSRVIKNLKNDFDLYTSEITDLMDDQIKHLYREEVKKIFMQSIDHEDEKDIFNLTNFLLHYINWDNSFYNFYETTCDLIYTQLKSLENRFGSKFRIQLKAFLAYHSKVKVLKRFFEKRELGKITTISYLEWITDIRDFLIVEFEKIFGEQKAIEYIMGVDQLLDEALENK